MERFPKQEEADEPSEVASLRVPHSCPRVLSFVEPPVLRGRHCSTCRALIEKDELLASLGSCEQCDTRRRKQRALERHEAVREHKKGRVEADMREGLQLQELSVGVMERLLAGMAPGEARLLAQSLQLGT